MAGSGDELNRKLDHFAAIAPDPLAMEQVIQLMVAGVEGITAPGHAARAQGVTAPVQGAVPPTAAPDGTGERLFRWLTLLFGLLALAAGLTREFWLFWLMAHKALLIGLMLLGSVCLITPLLLLPALKDEGACVREGGRVIC